MSNSGALMIKILPAGTTAILKYGLKPTRNSRARGRLGEGSKEHLFEMGQADLQAAWRENRVDGNLTVKSDSYVRSVTIDFHFRLPGQVGETTVWSESFSDEFKPGRTGSIPGTLSGKTPREGAWALWISESADSDGIFFRQTPPVDYPVRFHCRPAARILSITWDLNREFAAEEALSLPTVEIGRGGLDRLVGVWR